ncbi:MAG: hypothetical protein ACR2PA_11655 [Hyphomicrobiaceae bacterium]
MMNLPFSKTLAAGLVLAGGLALSATSAMAACGPGYKPVKWGNSGNTVCVLIAGYPTDNLAANPSPPQPMAEMSLKQLKLMQSRRAKRRKR